MALDLLRDEVEERGFAIVSHVLEQGDVDCLLAQLSRFPLQRSRAGARHALIHPAIGALANDPRLLGLARDILGQHAQPFRATVFDKSLDTNWLVVWHQDTALPLREKREVPGWGPWSVKSGVIYSHAPDGVLAKILALRIHLDDSTRDNGPLRVLAGSHRRGVLTDDAIEKIAAQADAVACVVPRGGVLVMRPLLVHASSKSTTEAPRRVVHIEYSAFITLDSGLELAVA